MGNIHGTIKIDKALSDLSIKFRNGAFIADMVLPKVSVAKETDYYYVYDKTDKLIVDAVRANGAPANEAPAQTYTTASYECIEYALKAKVTDRDRANADPAIDLEMDETSKTTNMIELARERRVAALVTAAATFATSGHTTTLSGVDQFDNASFTTSGVSIEKRMDTAKTAIRRATGVNPNYIVIPDEVAKVIKRDSTVRALIKDTDSHLLTNGDLPPVLWNMNVIIPGAVNNSANLGQAYTGADVWGKHILLFYRDASIKALRTMTFGASPNVGNRTTKKWRDDDLDSTVIQVSEIIDEVIMAEYCGYLYRSVIA